jgi:uracil-DNA glycosylase family 4
MLSKPEGCRGCPLEHCGKGYVPGAGPRDARLLVVGEAPGKAEIAGKEGVYEPFVGPSGALVERGLGGPEARKLVRFENVRRCLPPEDESEEVRKASIAHCTAAYLNQSLLPMTETRATLLIGADALEWGTALRAYTWADPKTGRKIHEPGIMQYHGSVFTTGEAKGVYHGLTGVFSPLTSLPPTSHSVVVTLHPAFALRGQKRFMPEILANIRRAWTAANSPAPRSRAERQEIIFDPHPADIVPSIETVLDIENPEDRPSFIELCCVTQGPKKVFVFDWKWGYKEVVAGILADSTLVKIGHNFSHDIAAFLENGLEVVAPVFDTIVAAARVWPPVSQKKAAGEKEKIPVKWLSLDRVALRLLADIVYWKRPETRATKAFYRAAFPNVPEHLFRKLYNGLDGIYNHRAKIALRELMQRKGLLERFAKIDMAAFRPMVNMERRGMLVDTDRRDQLRQEAEQTKLEAEARIREIVGSHHYERRRKVIAAIAGLEVELLGSVATAPTCPEHTDYLGLTKRKKCEGCLKVYEEAEPLRARLKDLKARIKKGRGILERIGDEFDPSKPDHWRWLLFDPDGLNSKRAKKDWIRPAGVTKKKKIPQIDDKAMEILQRRHPEVELFRLKVDSTYAQWRLNNTLHVGLDDNDEPVKKWDGYARTRFSIHRASTARYASGTDKEDSEKIRFAAAGNQQNIPDADRSIYIAPPGWRIMSPDYSQIEARVTAWRAEETRLLDAWLRGEDIHTNNAILLAEAIGVKLRPEEARELIFPYDPQRKSYRDNGKILTHAWDYGMDVAKTARDFGLPREIAARLHAGYFEAYPRLLARIKEVEAAALETGWLRNNFGLWLGPYDKEKRDGVWRLVDRNEALAGQPQSDVGDMMKVVSKDLDALNAAGYISLGSTLRTTMHDNFWIYVVESRIPAVAKEVKRIMERAWPEMGVLPGYGLFRCPVEISIGQNGGKMHLHDEKCLAAGCEKTENADGLVKMKEEDHEVVRFGSAQCCAWYRGVCLGLPKRRFGGVPGNR